MPWAANLLPESEHLRAVGRFLGTSTGDVIGILGAIGRDTAGALSIGRPGRACSGRWEPVPDEAALERIITELPAKPFLIGEDGVSMSLAGAQTKLGVLLDANGRICIPTDGAPSTHILKPDTERLWGSVQDEAFCLVLARKVGIPTLEVTTGNAGSRTYLLVRRYDRVEVSPGHWRRLHQEDFCQALGKPPSSKYESNQTGVRGPTLSDMMRVTRERMSPIDTVRLLDMVVFNVLACNSDAHAKNYSIMIGARTNALPPLYDVMCGQVWDNVTQNLAQKVAGKNRGAHLHGRHWQTFAEECGLNPRQTHTRVHTLAKAVLRHAASAVAEVEAMPAGGHPLLDLARQAVERRARALITQLSEPAVDVGDDLPLPAGRDETPDPDG